jgi:hypothetical protein
VAFHLRTMINRRLFLRQLGAASLVVTGSTLLPSIARATNFALPETMIRVRGKVVSASKGIPNVSVTDGISVTRTNTAGEFQLLTSNSRDFVYISIPRGYAIPKLPNGSADFFERIDKSKSEANVLFQLHPLQINDEKHHLLLLADTQIQDDYEATQLLTVAAPDIAGTVKRIGDPNTFGIGCGDLVYDNFPLYKEYTEAIRTTGVPFFQVVGNHDLNLDARSDQLSIQTFKGHFGPNYYSFDRGEIHYIVLDTVFFLGNRRYIGHLPEEQLLWLEQDLQFVEPGRTVVIATHIPLVTGAVTRYPDEDHISGTVSNRDHVYHLLSRYNTHILSGHTHFNDNTFHGKIFEHCHGTVCGAWWSGPICHDGTPNGYGIYEFNGSDVSWRYKATGLDDDYQFRVYKRGYHPEYKDYMSVNVWNWDPAWKVTWFEDGIRKGEMLRIVSKDPLSIELHTGDNIPARRTWVEPQLTDHMFYFNPDPASKEVRVEVRDRFGKVFSQTA